MKFITNNQTDNHLSILTDNLKLYDEAFFAVAFLKVSGLNKLITSIEVLLNSGGQISIIAGQNFALTEPEALHTLRKLFQPFPSSKIYLAKAIAASSIFHPKLYLFKSDNECCIISGSANITNGGLTSNKEASLIAECNSTDALWIDANDYFTALSSSDNADEATLLVIKQYETFYEQQKKFNKQTKPIPIRSKSQLAFDYDNLQRHFRKYNNSKRQNIYEEKLDNYKEAKKVLDKIADTTRLTEAQFAVLLDSLVGSKEEYSLWHSGSLYRLRRSVYHYHKEFQDLVRYIRENKTSPATVVFESAKKRITKIDGAGVNYMTEIMMTYNPKNFANLNRNPITVLKSEGGVNIKASTGSFTGVEYEEYCDLVKEISAKLGLRDMLEADSFFNDIYWKLK